MARQAERARRARANGFKREGGRRESRRETRLVLRLRCQPLHQVQLEPTRPVRNVVSGRARWQRAHASRVTRRTHCRISGAAFSLIHACRNSAKSVCRPPSGAVGGSSGSSIAREKGEASERARDQLPRGGRSVAALALTQGGSARCTRGRALCSLHSARSLEELNPRIGLPDVPTANRLPLLSRELLPVAPSRRRAHPLWPALLRCVCEPPPARCVRLEARRSAKRCSSPKPWLASFAARHEPPLTRCARARATHRAPGSTMVLKCVPSPGCCPRGAVGARS